MHRFALIFFLCFTLFTSLARADDRPNILVILCDDLGYGDLECYGHPHIKTPHLNQLANAGMRFTDFYSAAPVCSPSRVGLLTGRSPNRAGVYDWIPANSGSPKPDARDQVHMRASEVTIPALLREAGYATCMSGKWHCNSRFNHAAQPQPGDFGFDHWFATQNNAGPSHQNPKNFVRNGKAVGQLEGFSCQLVTDEVIQWLDRRENKSRPFFAYVAFHEPHEPVASPPDLVARYRPVARSEDEAQYFANVANVDRAVGRLMSALEERELAENTLVIFTSDNGPETLNRYRNANRSFGRPTPLRGMKLHTHEAGFRVAGMMRWPNRIQPKQSISSAVSSLDFLPTFCELAGIAPPERTLDGESFLDLLEGQPWKREKPLIWCYFNALNQARVAMRYEHWKILARIDGGTFPKMQNVTVNDREKISDTSLTDFEVYDLATDIEESRNLSAQPHTDQLKQKLRDGFRELTENSHVWGEPGQGAASTPGPARSTSSTKPTWGQRLGWPADKRVLILHADDIGMCYEANLAAKNYLTAGHIQSAAMMVPCPWFNEIATWYAEHPEFDLGLHLTLTAEWKWYRWPPLSARTEVPGLFDSDGYMWHDVRGVATHATPAEVEKELRNQIQLALKRGPKPGHIDTHMGTLYARPDYAAVYLKLAEEYRIPAMAIENTPEVIAKFQEQGYPLDDRMRKVIDSYSLPKLDDFHAVESAATYREKKNKFFQLVRSMRPGLNEVIFHPSISTAGLRKITGSWQQRIWEAEMFADPEVIRFFQVEGVEFTNWKEIMRRFERK